MKINFRTVILILSGLCFYASDIYSWTCPLPDQPTNLTATAVSSSQINLSWNDVSGESGYKIYRNGQYLTSVGANVTNYPNTGLQPDTTYCYRVRAYNSCGNSSLSLQACAATFACSEPPGQATAPSPANGATNVSVTTDLSWTAGSGATSHDVYFGTNPTPGAGEYKGEQAGTTFDTGTMSTDTTYYWRIDEKNACGTTTGDVWSFTTICTTSPGKATRPAPANEATSVSVTTDLSWKAGAGATSHDVYFGTSSPGTFQGNQTGTTFDTGTMSNDTTYYWRIDEKNACGTTTGDVWSFTIAPGEIIEINSDITTNQLWTANNIYYVTNDVNVQALLVIEPGTLVLFGYGCGLFVNNGGTLISRGTPDKPIIYTCDFMYFTDKDIGYYWTYFYYGYEDPYYLSPIYIEETASPATTVTYSFIEGAAVAIATVNITLDHPIENNYLFGNINGISEYGTKHTDIKNNLCYFSDYSGIEVYLADVNGTGDANSHILIQNNTCDSWQQYGITVHGVADSNDAGRVMLINNIVSYANPYGLNLVDGYMNAMVLNTGYCGNTANKNWEFEEINPVETSELPYVDGPFYLDTCYLNQSCPFINAGVAYIDETPLIGRTTNINGTPDSNFVDIGFHHPNWNYSNEPNIIPTISGDPNTGWVEVGASGYTPDTQRIFLLADGKYVGEIFGFREGYPLGMDISEFGSGERQLKVISVDSATHVTCSNITNIEFSCPLNYCLLPSSYEPNKPLCFSAFNPSGGDVSVKVYADCGNLVWSQTYSGDSLFGSIPAEITGQHEIDYVSFGEASIFKMSSAADPTGPPSFDVKALIVLPDNYINLLDIRTIWAVQTAFKDRGIKYKKLAGGAANYDTLAFYAATNPVKYMYVGAHGGYVLGTDAAGTFFRTFVELSDGPTVSIKQSDYGAPEWCSSLGSYWEPRTKSFASMGFQFLEFAYFDSCESGILKINENDQLVVGQPGDLGQAYDGPQSDMSFALGMEEDSRTRVYHGWWNDTPRGMPPPWPENEYQKWTRLLWERLGDEDNLDIALMYVISQQTKFGKFDPVKNYRLKGQGFFWDIRLRN
jgi:hypothetical protein